MKLHRYIVVVLLFCAQTALAQEKEVHTGDFISSLQGGFNYSRLNLAEVQLRQVARPFLGLRTAYVLGNKWHFNAAGMFSMKGSEIRAQKGIQQIGFDFQLYQQFRWDDLYFNAGAVYDWPINSGFYTLGSAGSQMATFNRSDYDTPKAHMSILLGFEFKLMNNWRMGTNFYVPYSSNGTNNLQFSLTYQISHRTARKESARRIRKRIAGRQIRQLRDGALLVRLKTSAPTIRAMQLKGMHYEAEQTKKQQRMENVTLIRAFEQFYTFSEVRFFMSHDSKKVKAKEFEGIFVNDSLEVDSNLFLRNKKRIIIAEYADIEPDTAVFFSHYEWIQTGDFSMVQVPRYYNSGVNSFIALVIRDENFEQLHRPFPYYSRALYKAMQDNPGHGIFFFPVRLFSPMTPAETVKNLNDKLYRYWQKNKR
ncbi:MAG: hypothetical protein WD530_03670 [Vicingaceae bacterium]